MNTQSSMHVYLCVCMYVCSRQHIHTCIHAACIYANIHALHITYTTCEFTIGRCEFSLKNTLVVTSRNKWLSSGLDPDCNSWTSAWRILAETISSEYCGANVIHAQVHELILTIHDQICNSCEGTDSWIYLGKALMILLTAYRGSWFYCSD